MRSLPSASLALLTLLAGCSTEKDATPAVDEPAAKAPPATAPSAVSGPQAARAAGALRAAALAVVQ